MHFTFVDPCFKKKTNTELLDNLEFFKRWLYCSGVNTLVFVSLINGFHRSRLPACQPLDFSPAPL